MLGLVGGAAGASVDVEAAVGAGGWAAKEYLRGNRQRKDDADADEGEGGG